MLIRKFVKNSLFVDKMSELIEHFGVDWKLLLAQAVNFFILLFILKRFAYGPIIKILKKRREDIEKGIKYTQEAETRLNEIGKEKEVTLNAARAEALNIVTQGENAAKRRKDEIIKEAHLKVESVVTDAKRLIEEEKAKTTEAVFKSAESLVERGIEKVIGKIGEENRNRELIKEALKELKTANQ